MAMALYKLDKSENFSSGESCILILLLLPLTQPDTGKLSLGPWATIIGTTFARLAWKLIYFSAINT